jgi:hypothetical protein
MGVVICCYPVWEKDYDSLLNNLVWARQLGGCHEHDAVIVADADMEATKVFDLKREAERSFKSVAVEATDQSVVGWPTGANSLFLAAARFCQQRKTPFLFCEPDAIPLKPAWLDSLEVHYRALGAKYMGSLVKCSDPRLPAVHLPGVSVYPSDAYSELGPTIVGNPSVAFDISTAHLSVPKATDSKLFSALWGMKDNPPTFAENRVPGTNVFDLNFLDPKAVIYHRCKDGTLIDLLRKRAGINQRTFIQLGRAGDVILLMPAMRWLYLNEGVKPRLITSAEFGPILDGVSYVEPVVLDVHWWYGMKEATEYAKKFFGGATVVQCHADKWVVNLQEYPTFMESTHSRTGVPWEHFTTLPMVFDRRSPERELKHLPSTNGKPLIAVNMVGFSSPFPHANEMWKILNSVRDRAHIIDLSTMKLPRIYDLLGLFDRAVGTIHIDTSTLHLAHGSPSPYIAFTRGGWATSTPRGNCVLKMEYAEFNKRKLEIVNTIESWLPKP